MVMPADDMLLFVEVVRHKSFTIAAQKIGKTPAAVSGRVTKLERELGVKLLKRTTRRLALTDAGSVLYEQCSNMHTNLQDLVEQVKNQHKHPAGLIKISSMPNFSNLILSPLIEKFMQEYPAIEFDINLDNSLYSLPPIDEYDIAFRAGQLMDSSAVIRHLFSHDYVICASPKYFNEYGYPNQLSDLASHNCVDCRHTKRAKTNIWTFYKNNEIFNVSVKGNITTDNALFIKHLALNGAALVYSPSFILAEEINKKLLVPVLTEYSTIKNPISLIHPYTDKNMPYRVRVFIDFILENLSVPSFKTVKKHESLMQTSNYN